MLTDNIILIMNISAVFLGTAVVFYSYKKEKAINPDVKGKIAKKIVIFAVIIGTMNSAIILIDHYKPKKLQSIYNTTNNTINVSLLQNDEDKIDVLSKTTALDIFNLGLGMLNISKFSDAVVIFESALNIVPDNKLFISKLIEAKIEASKIDPSNRKNIYNYLVGRGRHFNWSRSIYSALADTKTRELELQYYNAAQSLFPPGSSEYNKIVSMKALTQESDLRAISNKKNAGYNKSILLAEARKLYSSGKHIEALNLFSVIISNGKDLYSLKQINLCLKELREELGI